MTQHSTYALDAGYQGYTRARACTCPGVWARTRARPHRKMCSTYCFSTATMIRESTSVLRYTYIACLLRHVLILIPLFICFSTTKHFQSLFNVKCIAVRSNLKCQLQTFVRMLSSLVLDSMQTKS